jgi:hypothetical protein
VGAAMGLSVLSREKFFGKGASQPFGHAPTHGASPNTKLKINFPKQPESHAQVGAICKKNPPKSNSDPREWLMMQKDLFFLLP